MMILATALTAVFQFALARFLLPGEYSLLAALLAIVMIVGVPLGAIQAAVARDVAAGLADGSPERASLALRESARAVGRVAPFVALAAFAVGVSLAVVGRVHNFAPLIGLALTLACGLAFPVVWGGIQGMARFRALGLIQLGYAVAKLALGVALCRGRRGSHGSDVGRRRRDNGSARCGHVARPSFVRVATRPRARRRLLTKYNVSAAVGLGSFAILTTVDIVVARLTFTPPPAGAYSAASIGARVLSPFAVTSPTPLGYGCGSGASSYARARKAQRPPKLGKGERPTFMTTKGVATPSASPTSTRLPAVGAGPLCSTIE